MFLGGTGSEPNFRVISVQSDPSPSSPMSPQHFAATRTRSLWQAMVAILILRSSVLWGDARQIGFSMDGLRAVDDS